MSTEELRAIELLRNVNYGRVATSMRALPFLAAARHIVVDGRVLLRMHRGFGYHQACQGSVVAYGADNFNDGRADGVRGGGLWSVQFVGLCEAVEPTTAELELFGPAPHFVDGEPFDPVYMRIEPQFVRVHTLGSTDVTAARGGRPQFPSAGGVSSSSGGVGSSGVSSGVDSSLVGG